MAYYKPERDDMEPFYYIIYMARCWMTALEELFFSARLLIILKRAIPFNAVE